MTKITVDKETIEQALQQLNLLDGGAGVCESAHHVKGHQHTSREPCPIDKLHQDAIAALREALAEPAAEPVGWEWRWFDANPNTVTFGQWSEWKRVEPRNRLCTVEDSLNEFRAYIANGNRYELRALFASPPPPAEVPLLTTDEYTTLAHRIASKYTHRSDPQHIAYTFLPHTLEQFARAIERAVRNNAGLKWPSGLSF